MPPRLSLRLVPTAAIAWVVAFACTHGPALADGTSVVLWVATFLVVIVVAARDAVGTAGRPSTSAVLAVVMLAAGAATASHVSFAAPAREAVTSLEVTGGRDVWIHARVLGKVETRQDGSLKFDAAMTRIGTGATERATSVEVTVRVAPELVDALHDLDVGAQITARGTAAESQPGRRAVLDIRAGRGVEVMQPPQGHEGITAALRQALLDASGRLPGEGAGLVPGLAVGDTSAVSPDLDIAMKESSLAHLTAVSGANCALVVGLAFIVAAAAGASRALRVVAGLTALMGFVMLVTPEPSVLRAAVMAAIAMIGVLLGRPGAGVAVLSLAVTVLLVADPWLSGSLGFALSAGATASLLVLARPLARGLSRVMPRALALALAVPLSAQLVCGPLLVLITPQVSSYGILANLLAAPAAPAATILGLAACLAMPIPVLQDGLVALAWLPATWIATTAGTTSGLPGDLVPWPQGLLGALALAGMSAAVGIVIALRGGSVMRVALRSTAATAVCVVVGAVGGSALLSGSAGRWTLPPQWSMIACDIGQGDAVLLRSAGAIALIDTGPEPGPLAACLDRAGVDRIDLLVLTHFDLDHTGGLSAVEGRVDTVLHGPAHDDEYLLEPLITSGARTLEASSGLGGALGDARWRVLWPPARSAAFPSGNDASVVLDVRGGGIPPALLLGDLSASPQRALLASAALDPPYAVVKVAHHGSADQDEALYREAAASTALVSVGADNSYGHPRDEILQVLAGLGTTVARTDRDGLIALSRTTDAVEVWRERGG